VHELADRLHGDYKNVYRAVERLTAAELLERDDGSGMSGVHSPNETDDEEVDRDDIVEQRRHHPGIKMAAR
jgi:hypothetical protein